ncbi:acyl-CoA dehydrogenase [Rhodococcus sp. SC4]|uniref:acyl-CoA dehydrogenase family protein n=1 Tax=unclassified Rhodococcus (in: high G+C Gram-positive bacteria) TaxID=192944 RepID=UPI00076A2BC9|nr:MULTISPECIES: acyl-CoA dehydrogenase family protein [unclassified Rhodococcus (in: high G+C Gram-positive bacteria)]KXF49266.1 acyl-CoA dehydrogenase [Rhodococcus sp. SC4]KXX63131.1 acyl-CoA dehydrogenase [Rhodococcus sp. LB1]PBC56388.1 acyl-CoA dehydrogenase [Rhodococcus sp. ACPA1]
MWEFQTDAEFQEKLDWADKFVREECEPLDLLFPHLGQPYNTENKAARAILAPLRERVKEQGLWACHLGPELGGQGYGQIKLALLNEVLGRSMWAPTVFGTAAPDTGNAEILAMFGTAEQKAKYLQPLLDGDIVSSFSMTEPQAGSDPKEFVCAARKDGDEWVISGEKWFSSNARYASFLIVMAVTDLEASPYRRMSMFVVPAETPGIEIVRNVSVMGDREELDEGTHAYIRYNDVRVPADAILGGPGQGFEVAQARLGGGRVHHAMRTVGKCQRALDMMGERALSRRTQGEVLAKKQLVQQFIADSAIELEQYRLLVLKTAWIIDTQPHGAARTYIAMCKVAMAKVYHDIIHRAIQLHGSLGSTIETPLHIWWTGVISMGLADGPTEVHKVAVARGVLANYEPTENLFPTEHIPTRLAAAKVKHAAVLEEHGIA